MPEIFMEKEFYAVCGALVGVILTLLGGWFLKNREYKLKLWDKLTDKRISAHENVMRTSKEMQKVSPIGGRNKNNELRRIPFVLRSHESFDEFLTDFTEVTLHGSSWLTINTRRELYFIQDYLVNVHEQIELLSLSQLETFAEIIHFDFIDLSNNLEKIAYSFFEKEVLQLKIGDIKSWHKYDLSLTLKRLEKTQLYINYIQKTKK